MITIGVNVRPDGRNGYFVWWAVYHGESQIIPPHELEHFPATMAGRNEAIAYKRGVARGLRVAAEAMESIAEVER